MEGLQICVRMTDGISFSLSSHCHSNKGLIEGAGAPTRKRLWVRETGRGSWSRSTWGKDRREAQREGSLSNSRAGIAHDVNSGHRPTCRPRHILSSSPRSVKTVRQPSSPDRVPHVESIQRLCAVGAPSCQANKCWQPIGHVDEFVADGPRLLQQRARDKSNCPDPSFPQ